VRREIFATVAKKITITEQNIIPDTGMINMNTNTEEAAFS